jgi:hypothetical protein
MTTQMGKLKKSYSERVVSYRSPFVVRTVKEMFFVLLSLVIEE